MTETITRAKGGQGEHEAEISTLQVPDLWHIAHWLKGHNVKDGNNKDAGDTVLEVWHLAHDLLRHVREEASKEEQLQARIAELENDLSDLREQTKV